MFVDLTYTEARARTDPSFCLFTQASTGIKSKWEEPAKISVYVHNKQVSATAKSSSMLVWNELIQVIDRLHKKNSLSVVIYVLLAKPSTFPQTAFKRMSHLLSLFIYTEHLAKDCNVEIKCSECASTAHATALHPISSAWRSKSFPSTSKDGGAEDKVEVQEVNSTCTQVCGEGLSARACAKICLVNVFPNGRREESRRMSAILDDQSNCSLARSEFF